MIICQLEISKIYFELVRKFLGDRKFFDKYRESSRKYEQSEMLFEFINSSFLFSLCLNRKLFTRVHLKIYPDRTAASSLEAMFLHEGKTLESVLRARGLHSNCTTQIISAPTGAMKIPMDALGKITDNWNSAQ